MTERDGDAGGGIPLAYGPEVREMVRRAATPVDRILGDANPGVLPSSNRRNPSW